MNGERLARAALNPMDSTGRKAEVEYALSQCDTSRWSASTYRNALFTEREWTAPEFDPVTRNTVEPTEVGYALCTRVRLVPLFDYATGKQVGARWEPGS